MPSGGWQGKNGENLRFRQERDELTEGSGASGGGKVRRDQPVAAVEVRQHGDPG